MDKKISIVNTRDNEFEFDISIEGVKTEEMVVSFVIETKEVNLQFPCKKEGEKWAVVVPPMPLLELASYPFCVTIVVDGYFFKPFEGTAMVIHEPTVKSGEAKKMAPPVVTMKAKEEDEEEEEKPKKKPVRKKRVAKKKVAKKVEKKEEPVKEEPVKEEVKEEPVIELDPNDMGYTSVIEEEPISVSDVIADEPVVEETPVIEEPVVEEKDTFDSMADALLKKHRTPRAGLAPTSKKDKAVLEVLDTIEKTVPKTKKPTTKKAGFADSFGANLTEDVKEPLSEKDKKVQEILLGSAKKS